MSNIQKSAKLHRTALTMLIHCLISKSLQSSGSHNAHNANTWSNIQKSAKLHHMALTMLIHGLISKSLRSCTIWLLIHSLISKMRSCTYDSHNANTWSNIQKSAKLVRLSQCSNTLSTIQNCLCKSCTIRLSQC